MSGRLFDVDEFPEDERPPMPDEPDAPEDAEPTDQDFDAFFGTKEPGENAA